MAWQGKIEKLTPRLGDLLTIHLRKTSEMGPEQVAKEVRAWLDRRGLQGVGVLVTWLGTEVRLDGSNAVRPGEKALAAVG